MRPDPIVKVKHLSKQAPTASTGSLSKHFDWADITFDADKGIVLLRQKWKYIWQAKYPFSHWKAEEKRAFHERAEEQIWSLWNRKALVHVRAESAAPPATKSLIERLKGRWPEIIFDVQWVTESPQWNVVVSKEGRSLRFDPVQKIMRPMLPNAHVNWETREAQLYQISLEPGVARHPVTNERFNTNFNTVAHEFGHFLKNVDEQGDPSKGGFIEADLASLMNIGDQLRIRHFEAIKGALSSMIPGCTFAVVVK